MLENLDAYLLFTQIMNFNIPDLRLYYYITQSLSVSELK